MLKPPRPARAVARQLGREQEAAALSRSSARVPTRAFSRLVSFPSTLRSPTPRRGDGDAGRSTPSTSGRLGASPDGVLIFPLESDDPIEAKLAGAVLAGGRGGGARSTSNFAVAFREPNEEEEEAEPGRRNLPRGRRRGRRSSRRFVDARVGVSDPAGPRRRGGGEGDVSVSVVHRRAQKFQQHGAISADEADADASPAIASRLYTCPSCSFSKPPPPSASERWWCRTRRAGTRREARRCLSYVPAPISNILAPAKTVVRGGVCRDVSRRGAATGGRERGRGTKGSVRGVRAADEAISRGGDVVVDLAPIGTAPRDGSSRTVQRRRNADETRRRRRVRHTSDPTLERDDHFRIRSRWVRHSLPARATRFLSSLTANHLLCIKSAGEDHAHD